MTTAIIQRTSGEISSYAELRRSVKETLVLGQQKIEQEKVRTYWETGRLILNYLERQKAPEKANAEYSKRVIIRLAADLEMDSKVLYRAVGFAEKFPKFAARRISSGGLTWSHYRALLAVPDETKRLQWVERAKRLEWDSRDLEKAVKEEKEKEWKAEEEKIEKEPLPPVKKISNRLMPVQGSLYTYRLIESKGFHEKGGLKIDLGFLVRRKVSEFKGIASLKPEDIIESRWTGDSYRLVKAPAKTQKDLFTYQASVLRIVDGDTLYVEIDLGFGSTIEKYLRLRGIDCPEIKTAGGRRAKHFVENELNNPSFITISSSKSDQWDRYLTDVWYFVKGEERYLNNLLLERGLAKRIYS